jgi:1-deoxy-D-xylulose 5-phosphate reductoisomerase
VGAFLEGAVPFGDIARLVEDALQTVPGGVIDSLEAGRAADRAARACVFDALKARGR